MLLDLFLCFVQVGLFSIGGGYAAMPMIQAKAVEYYHWLHEQYRTGWVLKHYLERVPLSFSKNDKKVGDG